MKWMGNLALAAGLCLLVAGAGLWWSGQVGQQEAGREWESLREEAAASVPVPVADGATMARLWVPRLEKEEFIVKGASRRNLKRGPAWLAVTSPPGVKGNCVIAGHRDTHFRFLKDVQAGDEIQLEYGKRVFRYRVESLQVVKPENRELLGPARDSVLTLVTCYPFYYVGPAPKRFIVRAVLAGGEQQTTAKIL